MDIQQLYRIKSKFVTRAVGNELIIVPLSGNVAQMNELFTLNETAKLIWENLDQNASLESMQMLLTETFDVDKTTALNDVESFLFRMEKLLLSK
mgnify:FL=1